MNAFAWSVPVLLAGATLLTGCAGSRPDSVEPFGVTRTDKVSTVVYMVALHRERDRRNPSIPTGHGVVAVRLPGTAVAESEVPANAERISEAVNALLDQEPHGRHDSLWSGDCAPGDKVAGVRISGRLVTVVFDGAPGPGCVSDQAMTWLLSQQLAWTVADNSDFVRKVTVRFVDGSGNASERFVPDPRMVVGHRNT